MRSATVMNLFTRYWLHFMRYWHAIDLYTAMQVENWEMVTDCRLRIAAIDAELDRLECGG